MKLGLFSWSLVAFTLAAARESLPQEKDSQVRRYDLSGLVGEPRNAPSLICPQGPLVFSPHPGIPREMPLFGCDEMTGGESNGDDWDPRYELQPGRLVELVQAHLKALGLLDDQGLEAVRYAGGESLSLPAAPQVHQAVSGFLRAIEARTLVVECLLIGAEALESIAPSWRSEGPHLPEEVFDRALLAGAGLWRLVARSGQAVASGSKEINAFLVDHAVYQTGIIPVSNPVIEGFSGGLRLEVRPLVLPSRAAVRLELVLGLFQVGSRSAKVGSDWGDLELPLIDETLISTRTLVLPGKTLVAGSLQSSKDGHEPAVALVRVKLDRPLEGGTPPAGDEQRFLRVYDLPIPFAARSYRKWPTELDRARFSGLGEEHRTFPDLAQFLESLPGMTGEVLDLHRVLLWGDRGVHRDAERLLEEEVKRSARLAAIDLELLIGPSPVLARLAAETEDGILLRAGWEKVQQEKRPVNRRRYTVAGVAGSVHSLRVARLESYVTDCHQVSGGNGLTVVETSDPITSTCGTGIELRARVDFLPDHGRARLQVQGADAFIKEVREVVARFPSYGPPEGSGERGSAPARQRIKEVRLQMPRQAVRYLDSDLSVPLDRHAILQLEAAGDGEGMLLIGRIREIR